MRRGWATSSMKVDYGVRQGAGEGEEILWSEGGP